MCDLLNLDVEKKSMLSALNEGECIIRVNSVKRPFLMRIPLLKRELITMQKIWEKNKIIISKINEREDDLKDNFEPSIIDVKKDENNSKYQKFYDLIKDLYENQEKEKFLESKEHK